MSDAPGSASEHIDATVSGLVQGVGFRWFVQREAARLGLSGWVSNETDGSVRVVAEGPRGQLEALLEALRAGPPGAAVEDVRVRWEPARGGGSAFVIRSAAHRGD